MSSKTTFPMVSVIIPYFNNGRFLNPAVQSARAAFKGSMEIIVINDGSPEKGAQRFLDRLSLSTQDVKVITQENRGLAGARNAGLDVARGEFIQFLDGDDLLVQEKINRQFAQMKRHPWISASVCDYVTLDEKSGEFKGDGDPISRFALTLKTVLFEWERGFSIPIHCALFRRSAIGSIRFNEELRGKEDWVFWAEFMTAKNSLSYFPLLGAVYRLHGANMTKDKKEMGENWLRAAEIIDKQVTTHTGFMIAARKWYNEHYAR